LLFTFNAAMVSALLSGPLLAAVPAVDQRPAPARSDEAFAALLESKNRSELVVGCRESKAEGLNDRLRQLRRRLLELHEDTSSLAVVFADTEALLRCKAPDAALQVLERISPDREAERARWLELQWQAASAGLDLRRASLALKRLSGDSPAALNAIELPVAEPSGPAAQPTLRSALDLQAAQQEAMGDLTGAAALLQEPASTGVAIARRRQQAAQLLAAQGDFVAAEQLVASGIDLAAAASAWALSSALLEDQRRYQLALDDRQGAAATNDRRIRLSRRIGDGMGERSALLAKLADGSSEPARTQQLIDRRDPLERRRGALLDALLELEREVEGSDAQLGLARLDLASQVAMALGHRERALDLIAELERQARLQGLPWLRDRVNQLALRQALGNPQRRLEAIEQRQRELLEDPPLQLGITAVLDPERPQRQLAVLERQEQEVARQEQRFGNDPFPGSYVLAAVLEDLARLDQGVLDRGQWTLSPAQFGQLGRSLSAEQKLLEEERLQTVLASLELEAAELEEAQQRFGELARKLQQREHLARALRQDLAAGQLHRDAISRQNQWLRLEQELDPSGAMLRDLAGFGRSAAGRDVLNRLQRQQDVVRLWDRQQEEQLLALERLELLDLLAQQSQKTWDPDARPADAEQRAVALTRQWRVFRRDPGLANALVLQQQAAAIGEEAVELEALRLQLAELLPRGSADPETLAELQALELRLRSPQARGGHLGPSSPSR
jgi:hypothetical protein